MPILHIFPNVANDDETLLFFYIIFLNCYFINFVQLRKTGALFLHLMTNFTDFYDKLLKKLYDCNFTLNLIKKMMGNYSKHTVILPDQNFKIFLHQ